MSRSLWRASPAPMLRLLIFIGYSFLSSSRRTPGPITTGGGLVGRYRNSVFQLRRHGVWVPAFAGTTWRGRVRRRVVLFGCLKVEFIARNPLGVVPANAGTHNHRRWFGSEISQHRLSTATARRMGPCVRRDDVEREGAKAHRSLWPVSY